MNSRYKLSFSGYSFINKINNAKAPGWCSYSMMFAQNMDFYYFRELELFGMYYEFAPFVVNLIQINSSNETPPVSLDFSDDGLILFIMLEGKLSDNQGNLNNISIHPGEFILLDQKSTKLNLCITPGKYSFMKIAINTEWYNSISQDFNNIKYGTAETKYGLNMDYPFLCKATGKVNQWIKNIYNFNHANIGAIDGNLRMLITFLLEHYNFNYESIRESLAFKVKFYLDEHYLENNLNIKYLAEYFFVTERTLRNHFTRQFRKTIHNYYTELRMRHASKLINNEGLSMKDIYLQIGYNDESSFRYAYTRYTEKM